LNLQSDPFSRAVSPIHGDFTKSLPIGHDQLLAGFKEENLGQLLTGHFIKKEQSSGGGITNGTMVDHKPVLGSHQPVCGVEMRGNHAHGQLLDHALNDLKPFNPNPHPVQQQMSTTPRSHTSIPQILSAPPSPYNPHTDPGSNWSCLQASASALVDSTSTDAHPYITVRNQLHQLLAQHHQSQAQIQQQNQHQHQHQNQSQHQNQNQNPSPSPGFVALNKIRRPSLRTLMSTGGSQAPSPIQSPTLFDQPMQIEEEVKKVEEGVRPDTGWEEEMRRVMMESQVGMQQQQQSQGVEGLGLMGLEGMMPFQT